MKKFCFTIGFAFSFVSFVFSQVGGTHAYQFLNLTNSARVAALGGKNVSLNNNDLNMTFYNPALLTSGMDNSAILSYVNYFIDINYGYAAYAREIEGLGNFSAGLHYMNYGEFIYADETGKKLGGTFTSSDYALNLLYSKKIDSFFQIGINLKPIYSKYERYTSFGLALDIGATYTNRQKLFSAGFVCKNIGYMLKSYTSGNHEPLPFEIQAGVSQKLQHAPFRISVTAHQLQKPVLTYDEPSGQNSGFQLEQNNESQLELIGDNVLRHLIVGVDFIPIDNFYLSAGYNFQRRKELQVPEKVGYIGFSWGFGLKFNRFNLNYGRATYHAAGASNHFSLLVKLNELYRKGNF